MKNLILIMALLVGSISFAQNKVEKKSINAEKISTIDQGVEKLSENLDLSSEQQKKLKSILVKREDMVEKSQGNSEKIKEINKETRKSIQQILTLEQQQKLKEMEKERKTLKKPTKKTSIQEEVKSDQ